METLIFDAIWCPACLVMKPVWKDIEKENHFLKVRYFDFDKDKEMVKKYKIDKKLPVCIFLDDSKNEILRLEGEKSKNEITRALKSCIK